MKSMNIAGRGALGLWLLLAVTGCGGVTQELGDVAGSSSGGTAGSGGKFSSAGQPSNVGGSAGGSNAGSSSCETQCVQKVLSGPIACGLCHMSQPAPTGLQSSGLDLQSPNVSARLKDVPSKHTDLPPQSGGCPVGDSLIDSANPEQSWLLKKLKGMHGTCGDRMPQTGVLPMADLACLETYVYCVAAQ